jgi:hypothetical protein
MAKRHETPVRVAEPVQVYLAREDRRTLERLAEQLDISMSDVLRKALAAFEQSMLGPDTHPSLRIIGIAGNETRSTGRDVATDHDEYLAALTDESITTSTAGKAKKRGR